MAEQVSAGEETIATYRLPAVAAAEALEVVIEGARPEREVTKRTLEQREIARIPGTSGDALRSIESLPGVARPPLIAGMLVVRGAGPMDTETFIDHVPVPMIYHFGGLSSVVPTELLSKIDFYPGNFGAQYGRVLGGIIDAGMRSPRSDGYHGLAQADLIDARLMLEGPIPAMPGWTFAVAARRSHMDAWLRPVLRELGASAATAPIYWDYQLMIETKPTARSRYRASFYGSDDRLELLLDEPPGGQPTLGSDIGVHTSFARLVFTYDYDFTDRDELRTNFALGAEDVTFGMGPIEANLKFRSLTGHAELRHRLARQAKIDLGFDLFSGLYRIFLRVPQEGRPGQPSGQPFSTRSTQQASDTGLGLRPSTYLELELSPTAQLHIVPGLRFDIATESDRPIEVTPRLNARYSIMGGFPQTTLKGGIGVFLQPPQLQEELEPIGSGGLKPNRAIHYGLGVEQDITRQIELSVEGFYKQLDQLVVPNCQSSGAELEYTNDGRGYIVGGELLLKYKPSERFFGWLAYTLSRSVRQNSADEPEYLADFDQPHILTLLGSYRLGHGWELGARFRLVSGNLVTPYVCDASIQQCDPNRIGALLHGSSGIYRPLPSGSFRSERLPLYHELDVRVDKRWKFASWQFSAYLDVINADNQRNVEGVEYNYNFTRREYVTGLPIIPSIGLRGEF
ncbi:MAG: TonB-dependent receptor [Deltaproteobacteria bacterium]|nr:TonB-dependent receptor [Deltaproteobacteria bacterium]